MDITFHCDKCGQSITIDEAGAGAIVECPKCSESVVVPEQKRPAQTAASNLRHCPDCAREVSKRAAACPHCGAPLGTSSRSSQQPTASVSITSAVDGPASSPLSKILAILVIIAAMVGGFLAYHFWKDRPLATTLEGEVFIVTKGGQNFKLGLVTVGVEKADVLKKRIEEEKHDLNAVKDREAYETKEASAKIARDNYDKGTEGFGSYEEALKEASQALDTYEEDLVDMFTVFRVFEPSYSTKTDADGRFSMPMPGSGLFVLTARAERDVGEKVEHYYWFLPLPPAERGKIKVSLSNDNLTSPGKIVDFDFAAMSLTP